MIFADGCYWHCCDIHKPEAKLKNKGRTRLTIDKRQNTYLKNRGFIVLRFWEHDINNRLDWCIEQILAKIEEVKSKKDLVLI